MTDSSIEPGLPGGAGSDQASVIAVVVAYEPDFKRLGEVLAAAMPQVRGVVLVNNGPPGALDVLRRDGVSIREMGGNRGLAAGLNAGIRAARRSGASHVLLLDQDSVPQADMVARLLEALDRAGHGPWPACAAGPLFVDACTAAPAYFVRFGRFGLQRMPCRGTETVRCDFLITSGTLIPVAVLERVGLMDEALFIEHVDTDWHLRARAAGYRALGVCGARLSHQRGRKRVRLGGFGLPCHAPLRHYYLFRNSLWLYRRPYAPLRWVLADGLRMVGWLVAVPLIHRPRRLHLRAVLRGIRDGLRGPPY